MSGFIDPVLIPVLLTGILMLLLAAMLLLVDFRNTLHRVFALYLIFQALAYVVAIVRNGAGPEWHVFYTGLTPYMAFPGIPLALLFISLYPRRRWIGRWAHGTLGVTVVTVALMLWYMLDHGAYGTIGATPDGYLASAGRGMAYIDYGPLFLLASLRWVMSGAIALILARDYWKAPEGSTGFSRFLVYAGFALNALFNGTRGLLDLIFMVGNGESFPWWPYGWGQYVMPVVGLPLAVASLVYIYRASKGEGDTPTLQEPRRFLWYVAPLPIISGLALGHPGLEATFNDGLVFVLGIWRLALPVLITYALLRFQVFGADMVIKQSLGKVVLTVMFTAIFFAVLESAESLLGDNLGWGLNIGIAALLALVAAPLQRVATSAANRIMPDTKAIVEQSPHDRGEFYRSQFELVAEDHLVSPKDREMLNRLAFSLQLTKAHQDDLEGGVNKLSTRLKSNAVTGLLPSSRWHRIWSVALAALTFGAFGQMVEAILPAGSFGFSLLGAAFVAAAIGPIEKFVGNVLEPRELRRARRHRLISYRKAVQAAHQDGRLSTKEKQYLDNLQIQLGLSRTDRARIDLRVARRFT